MEHTPQLYDTLVHVLRQHATWLDQRHLKTLAWMMVGLIQSGWISLTAWAPYVVSRAQYAQSTVRRFRRWLNNDKLDVLSLYGPLMQQALAECGEQALYVALDTSMLWNTYCLIRLSVIYRGRAVPLVWCVLHHGSAQVAFGAYRDLLDRAALQGRAPRGGPGAGLFLAPGLHHRQALWASASGRSTSVARPGRVVCPERCTHREQNL